MSQCLISLINMNNITLPEFLRGQESISNYKKAINNIAKFNMIDSDIII